MVPYIEKILNLKEGKNFDVIYNPEFIALGSVLKDMLNPEFILVGINNKKNAQIMRSIYKKFIGKEKISLYGKNYEVEHFTLKSKDSNLPDDKKLNFDVWFDKKTGLILKVKYSRMGDWEYRLKSYK